LRITNLKLQNYRNINDLDYQPGPGLNIITGQNGQGKTNLLESIFVLAAGYSFRAGNYQNLLAYDKNSFSVKIDYSWQERQFTSQLDYKSGKAKFFINNKNASHRSEDTLKVVLFTPDDLYIVKGTPAKRRSFVDFVLCQISPDYRYDLDNYSKTLKKRNLLLKQEQTNSRTFGIINQIFIENAVSVIIKRINFINLLAEIVNNIYKEIDTMSAEIKIKYAVSFPIDSARISLDILYQALEQSINNNRKQEKLRRTSLSGPHIDDINIYHNDKLARFFSSQGQQRTIALSMKLAEMYTFKKIKGFYPIFLLDEVLSELDNEKQRKLLEQLEKEDFQSFLTSVYIKPLTGNTVIIENGCLRRD
jgi:DNA replication and repair protein RecF